MNTPTQIADVMPLSPIQLAAIMLDGLRCTSESSAVRMFGGLDAGLSILQSDTRSPRALVFSGSDWLKTAFKRETEFGDAADKLGLVIRVEDDVVTPTWRRTALDGLISGDLATPGESPEFSISVNPQIAAEAWAALHSHLKHADDTVCEAIIDFLWGLADEVFNPACAHWHARGLEPLAALAIQRCLAPHGDDGTEGVSAIALRLATLALQRDPHAPEVCAGTFTWRRFLQRLEKDEVAIASRRSLALLDLLSALLQREDTPESAKRWARDQLARIHADAAQSPLAGGIARDILKACSTVGGAAAARLRLAAAPALEAKAGTRICIDAVELEDATWVWLQLSFTQKPDIARTVLIATVLGSTQPPGDLTVVITPEGQSPQRASLAFEDDRAEALIRGLPWGVGWNVQIERQQN